MTAAKRDQVDAWVEQFRHEGCVLLPGLLSTAQVEVAREQVAAALTVEDEAIRQSDRQVYAARNLLDLYPAAQDSWRVSPLPELLTAILGEELGLVRGLYFDKPPGQTWSLPWHKDLLIAVAADSPRSVLFSTPRDRAGVPHSEAPVEVLSQMVTVRLHLDDMTNENGPVEVLLGSHKTGKELRITGYSPRKILGKAGDVFVMSPLLVHASGSSSPDTTQHRRIVHLEFCGLKELPDSVRWHRWISSR